MCGRFESKRIDDDLLDLFKNLKLKLEIEADIHERATEDIRPTQKVLTVLLNDEVYRLTKVIWGIKFSDDAPLIFNSRIETIKEKKYWNTLLAKNRCVVPMTGFYEWKTEGNRKIKYRIYLSDQRMFFVPAIYQKDKENKIHASLITTTPNKFIQAIHHRMPVILNFDEAIKYLNEDVEDNIKRCRPYDNEKPMELELLS
jgi:putative SOS response-associated peptidase YedK